VGLSVVVLVPACLVMSTPDLEPPRQTAPFLVAATADPDPRGVVVIDLADLDDKQGYDFKSQLVSEDASQDVRYQLYTDYGYPDEPYKRPYRGTTPVYTTPAGSMTDKTREPLQVRWFPKQYGTGCHNVTLIASHGFDPTSQCPVCPADASQITWQVYLCNSMKGISCAALDFSECQQWTKSCALNASPDAGAQCNTE
jgi:hypothetical protein